MTEINTGASVEAEPKPEPFSKYICTSCDYAKITVKEYEDYPEGIKEVFCNKINREIFFLTCQQPHEFLLTGCASHSDFNVCDTSLPSSTPQMVVCQKGNQCTAVTCFHRYPHLEVNTENKEGRMDNCNRIHKCEGMTQCVPCNAGVLEIQIPPKERVKP